MRANYFYSTILVFYGVKTLQPNVDLKVKVKNVIEKVSSKRALGTNLTNSHSAK